MKLLLSPQNSVTYRPLSRRSFLHQLVTLSSGALVASSLDAQPVSSLAEPLAAVPAFKIVELAFTGPVQTPADTPARDIDFWVRLRHESGAQEYKVHGYWDGDGRGGTTGGVFKIRFAPPQAGMWTLVEVHSNSPALAGQLQGDRIRATASRHPGFWVVDEKSAGRRWFQRSDGSHQYVIGNTHYSFLSEHGTDGPTGTDIAADVRQNAHFFKKLRFSVHGDRYMHPVEKPFFDDTGAPTADGDYSHRPNPRWFLQRTDTAVQTAEAVDLIADLILCGPDTPESRATLRAARNDGDPTPWLKYAAARYGAFPHVWFCLANEFNIRHLPYTVDRIAECGAILRRHLPFRETPVSVHPWSAVLWVFDGTGEWYSHHIIQKKRRQLAVTAEFIDGIWRNADGPGPRLFPTVNDELSYQGAGDQHSEEDSLEAVLGAFLGGGYSSVGYKSGDKLGHYFCGAFTPEEHTAAAGLKWLRDVIDTHLTFWRMEPDNSAFPGLDPAFRALAWTDHEYAVGTTAARETVAQLPSGEWTVTQFDVVARRTEVLSAAASGRFTWTPPASRAVLTHFKRNP